VAARFRGKRLTIIGGGVTGLMTAYYARRWPRP
jgi:glycine/D-amino acid oxidase-like deaminating enzyme